MEIPNDYIVHLIYQYCARPIYRKSSEIYNFECPICNEGKSTGKKRRGFYIVPKSLFICHNCQQTWSTYNWIKQVTGLTYSEISKECSNYNFISNNIHLVSNVLENKRHIPSLPSDCINLSDPIQLEYHKNNPIIKKSLDYINFRRLNSAINKPKSFYISTDDYVHKNRVIIPFYDLNGKIIYYQSRKILSSDPKPKYISKVGGNPSIFNIDKIDNTIEYIFLFEGPIDSMFVKNGIGICGLTLKPLQEKQLSLFPMHKKIWVLDNQFDCKEVIIKYRQLIEKGENIFFYPDNCKLFKDINEICIHFKLDKIPYKFFINNSYSGLKANMKLNERIKNQ
jgi:hypothetical protein